MNQAAAHYCARRTPYIFTMTPYAEGNQIVGQSGIIS